MTDQRIIDAMKAHAGEPMPVGTNGAEVWSKMIAAWLDPVIRELQADAWDEGKFVGELDPELAPPGYGKKPSNPYRGTTNA